MSCKQCQEGKVCDYGMDLQHYVAVRESAEREAKRRQKRGGYSALPEIEAADWAREKLRAHVDGD